VNLKKCLWFGLVVVLVCSGCGVYCFFNAKNETPQTTNKLEKTSQDVDSKKPSTNAPYEKSSKSPAKKITPEADVKEKEVDQKKSEITESLNKKTGKVLAKFKDGETITESEINAEMEKIPDQLSEKMSLKDIKLFLILKAAFDYVVMKEAKKEGVDRDPKILEETEKKKITIAGMMLLNEKAEELMTDDALEKHYNEIWDTNFKGTKEFSLKVITTTDKDLADKIAKTVKDEKSLAQIVEVNKTNLKAMDLNNRPESLLPTEIIEPIKTKGENSVIGPFLVNKVFMLFFVKKIAEAKKHEFSGKFKEEYKKTAMSDFMQVVSIKLYKENKVKFLDVNGKEVDIEEHNKQIRSRSNKNSPPYEQFSLGKLKDDTVVAYINGSPVTASDIKTFFKLKSLQDESLLMMAHQFNMSLREILVYATKLVVDDKLLAAEVKATRYLSKPNVKEKIADIEKSEIEKGFLKKHISVSQEQVRKVFNNVIKSIPEEDKNDHEIAVKMIFFEGKEEAEQVLASIRSGSAKFNDLFKMKETSDKSAVDLKYVTKKVVPQELWAALKRSAAGACYKETIELDGSKFGVPNKDYAIIYIGDRRPLTLPSLSNPADKRYFETMAYQEMAVEFVISLLNDFVVSILDKSLSDVLSNSVAKKMIEAMVIGNA
jgi:hypothetical protein